MNARPVAFAAFAAFAALAAAAALASSAVALAATPTKAMGKTVAVGKTVVGNVTTGKKLFKVQDCGSCHMMAAAGAFDSSDVGPDLDTITKTYAQIVTQISKGGHGMTGYKKILSTAQIQDLAAFIYTSSHPKH